MKPSIDYRPTKRGRLPIVSSMVYLPRSHVRNIPELKKYLTVEYNPNVDDQDGEIEYIRLYDTRTHKGYIGLPRHFAMEQLSKRLRNAFDHTVKPSKKFKYPANIKPRDKQQAEFMTDLAKAVKEYGLGPVDFTAKAKTGSGKTVSLLKTISDLGIGPVLFLVHINSLKRQWVGSKKKGNGIKFFFGKKWAKKNVGIVQQDVCDYKGKPIVIGMLPSIARRDYGKDFYNYFSAVFWDEVHKSAAPLLSKSLMLFPAAIRGGVTATPRKGKLARVIGTHLGKPSILSEQEVMAPNVIRVKLQPKKPTNLNTYSKYTVLTALTKWDARQDLLRKIIQKKGYDNGRQVLGLSDRTAQLYDLKQRLIKAGVPEKEIGLYVGSYETGNYIIRVKRPHSSRFIKYKNFTFPTRYKAKKYIEKQELPEGTEYDIAPHIHTPSIKELERISKKCSIVLATYGIFAVGVDIARLDMGVECSPRGNVVQALGRVLRILKGKLTPIWFCIDDVLYTQSSSIGPKEPIGDFIDASKARTASYREQNAKISRTSVKIK